MCMFHCWWVAVLLIFGLGGICYIDQLHGRLVGWMDYLSVSFFFLWIFLGLSPSFFASFVSLV